MVATLDYITVTNGIVSLLFIYYCTTVAFYAASIDTSDPKTISGVMAMDPVNSGGGPCFLGDACLKYPVAPNV